MNRDQLRISQLVGDICQLAVMINQSTDMYAFVDISGHVSKMDIYLTPKSNYNKRVTSDGLYYNESDYRTSESLIDKLTKLKIQLKKVLLDKKVDFDFCSYTIREEYDYSLL